MQTRSLRIFAICAIMLTGAVCVIASSGRIRDWAKRTFHVVTDIQRGANTPSPKNTSRKKSGPLSPNIARNLHASREIRVKLTAVRPVVSIDGDYRIQSLGPRAETLLSGENLQQAKMSVSQMSGLQVGTLTLKKPVRSFEIIPVGEQKVTVGTRTYRGRLQVYLNNDGGISLVNVLPLEFYLASVIDSEMPAGFATEARKAQAVVSRTYALVHMRDHASRLYDVTDSTRHQRYLGFTYEHADGRTLAGETHAGRKIAYDTQGLVCLHHEKLFYTYFSADCGGNTNRAASKLPATNGPMFQPAPDPFCKIAPNHNWTVTIPAEKAVDALLRIGQNKKQFAIDTASALVIEKEVRKNSLAMFWIRDGKGNSIRLDAWQLQQAWRSFGLRSPHFDVVALKPDARKADLRFQVSGTGHGHGVGFCQWGANGRAQSGQGFREILQSYFPGVKVVRRQESAKKTP